MSAYQSEYIVPVNTQPHPYSVYLGDGLLVTLGEKLREVTPSRRVVVVTDSNVGPLYAETVLDSLRSAGFEPTLVTVPAGEGSKSLATAGELYDVFARARLDRTSVAVSLGGGVIGDLTGFVASTWQRGIGFVQCPTTVEADVDASVGGKTAINHASGKNMIGAFHQPRFVLMDTATLKTLSERDCLAGLAESIKHAVIRDREFFNWHEAHARSLACRELTNMPELLQHNVRIKAEIVAQDEREMTGLRALLNFGHTVGHAVESAMAHRGDPWRHGECVAVGMVAACEISVAAGRLGRQDAERIVSVIEQTGLPIRAPLGLETRSELLTRMQADKKVAAGRLRFVLANAIGDAGLYADIQLSWLNEALQRILTTTSGA